MATHPPGDPSVCLAESAYEDDSSEQRSDAQDPDRVDGARRRAQHPKMVEDDTPAELPGDQRRQKQPDANLGSEVRRGQEIGHRGEPGRGVPNMKSSQAERQ